MAEMVGCGRCATLVDATTAVLGDDGKPICDSCDVDTMVESGFDKALAGYAGGAMLMGLFSLCFNPLMIVSILALMSAGAGTIALITNADIKAAAARKTYLVFVMYLGALFALARPALFGLAVMVGLLASL